MLRIYFVQRWFNRSDPTGRGGAVRQRVEPGVRRVELGYDVVPDEATILRFRHLLEPHQLTAALFGGIRKRMLDQRRSQRRAQGRAIQNA